MWLFTRIGFFSIVQKPGQQELTVRARAKQDLDALRSKYLPALDPTKQHAGSDYPFRATISRGELAAGMAAIVEAIDYANFKNAVADEQGWEREAVYSKAWSALRGIEKLASSAETVEKGVAYGGVIVDDDGRVLLREPANHFDGYAWTFAKGTPKPGETPQQAALREVQEETGVTCEIVAEVPGRFGGGTKPCRFFLMRPVRLGGRFEGETASIRWATVVEARTLIAKTTKIAGRDRDLAILAAAVTLWERTRSASDSETQQTLR